MEQGASPLHIPRCAQAEFLGIPLTIPPSRHLMDQPDKYSNMLSPASGAFAVGDEEAPANAIPNVIAHLAETETWRNAVTVMVVVLLLGLGYWSHYGVRDALTDARTTTLQALLDAEVRALDLWLEESRDQAERWARDPRVVASVTRLAALARNDGDAARFCAAPEGEALSKLLEPTLRTYGAVTYDVVDRSGRMVASNIRDYCGKRLKAATFAIRLEEVFGGKTHFVRPYPERERVLDIAPKVDRALAWIKTPVRDARGEVIAALGFGRYADQQFASILSTAQPGTSTEIYAFDDQGRMVSESRFTPELRELGLLPRDGPLTAIFQVQVRDPGGELGAGFAPELEVGARPLTRAAAFAVAARSKTAESERRGVLREPYRNYRGQEVIGAWRWLPAYGLGVVAEMSTAEALGPLRKFVIAYAAIGGFVVLLLGAALVSWLSLLRLQRQFGRLQRLGAYTLEREIDEGGMARIFLARHALLKRPTAVKILKKQAATDELIARFEREVQLVSQLRHPNTIQIYDYGRTADGEPYYVMEFLDGVNLAQLVAHSGPVPAARVIHALRQVCAALREAHLNGLVHRDIKPENVMLCQRGEDDIVKVLDFGLVKNIQRPETRDITKQVKILGTPVYMAPERIRNPGDVDARADLYAVGAVGFFMLTGRRVFEGEGDLEVTHQILHAPAPRPSERTDNPVPEALDALIARCLEKDRAARPQNAEELIEALGALAAVQPWTQREATLWWRDYRATAALTPQSPMRA
jgi:serine/threonine-protein kinase